MEHLGVDGCSICKNEGRMVGEWWENYYMSKYPLSVYFSQKVSMFMDKEIPSSNTDRNDQSAFAASTSPPAYHHYLVGHPPSSLGHALSPVHSTHCPKTMNSLNSRWYVYVGGGLNLSEDKRGHFLCFPVPRVHHLREHGNREGTKPFNSLGRLQDVIYTMIRPPGGNGGSGGCC